MPVRTKRLARGNIGPANSPATVYTCPPGETTIVKDVRVWLFGSVTARAQVFVTSGPASIRIVDVQLQPKSAVGAITWVVLGPGDTIHVQCDVADTLVFYVSGTELEGVAD